MESEFKTAPPIDAATEARRILEMCEGSLMQAMAVVERQLATLHSRAQVLFSFCGVVVTVTGFSGRLIAGTNTAAQVCVVLGLAVVVFCAFYVFRSVMTLRWTTQRLGTSSEETLRQVLERRNLKTQAYRKGGYILFVGLVLYGFAVAVMLLNPAPLAVPAR